MTESHTLSLPILNTCRLLKSIRTVVRRS